MADIEKVIKGLESCRRGYDCRSCPYKEEYDPEFDCIDKARKDAIELLKQPAEWLKRIVEMQEEYCDKRDILIGLHIAQDIINGEI